VQMLVKIKMM